MPRASETDLLPTTALPHEVLRAATTAVEGGFRVVMATVVARHGSAPSTPGQKLALIEQTGGIVAVGTIGGGAVERIVLQAMTSSLADGESDPRMDTFRLGPSLGMCCGGSVDVLIEPLSPAIHALVVGGGHVGVALAPLLASLGFSVTLCDARDAAADPARLGEGLAPYGGIVRVLHADFDDPEVLTGLPAERTRAAALVMTHDHQLDQRVLEWAIERRFGFVGGVGSRAKATRTRERLLAKGVGADDVARVRMPIGVDVRARSPAEIAVAIAAELIRWRADLRSERRSSTTRDAAETA